MTAPRVPAMNRDLEHLHLLSIFHYVAAGITALFACLPFIHLAIGIAMVAGGFRGPNPPPEILGWLFVFGAAFFILGGWTLAVLMVLTGRRLKAHAAWTFCFVIAAIECILMPLGTVLGVFTIVVLSRPTVKTLFGVPVAAAAPAAS
jgi:hypothetical protein